MTTRVGEDLSDLGALRFAVLFLPPALRLEGNGNGRTEDALPPLGGPDPLMPLVAYYYYYYYYYYY